ncbi:RNA-binding protein [Hydrogenophaga aromaticivorans]|uniref:RNA pseudouridine synthase n=1 Tax=Hydrogenophaga aromaticivorans TaxID=2610898 RepID=UPI001B39A57A|nr:RNA pseudouridine synthase [Hydrogenophaga aromaticivorans]MBQ0918230.1 RNA-binding protein [Hydrogenophaga aromaticivorans]
MSDTGRSEPQRLAKRLAAQLPCSRSDAERYIAGGWVRVDGAVVEEPMARVHDGQTVALDPKAKLESLDSVTLIWHKPAGRALPDVSPLPDALAAELFTNANRFKGDRSGVRPLKAHRHKLLPVAPLSTPMSGLMVFTQNPGVARKISDDSAQLEHEWLVEVAADPELDDEVRRETVLKSIGKALFFDGWSLPSARASWQSEHRLRLAIKGTRPGQVEHLCERAGLQLVAVRRLRMGRVALTGLPVGEWRYLLGYERF